MQARAQVETRYRSFGEQALAYFDRPHVSIRRTGLEVAAAWRGSTLAQQPAASWSVLLNPAQIQELEAAAEAGTLAAPVLAEMSREDFPLPTLSTLIRTWAEELRVGCGFVLLRGLPVARWGEDFSARVYWGLGLHLGTPGAQNPQGDILGHVVDTGEDLRDPNVRLYRTRSKIRFHCDLADVVGLLCLQTSTKGGASRLASSVTVYNEILRRRPDLIDRLYEPFLLDTRNDGAATRWLPIPPCRFDGELLRTFYHSDYFRSVVRHADAPPIDGAALELLELFEAIAEQPEIRFDMQLEPGDIQFVSNHFVVHARTAYEEDAGAQRHLLRLWLSLPRVEATEA
jgi:Taurine catabolism dioxygenase TauD, TfdA family